MIVVTYGNSPSISTVMLHSNTQTGVVGKPAATYIHLRTIENLHKTSGIKVAAKNATFYRLQYVHVITMHVDL